MQGPESVTCQFMPNFPKAKQKQHTECPTCPKFSYYPYLPHRQKHRVTQAMQAVAGILCLPALFLFTYKVQQDFSCSVFYLSVQLLFSILCVSQKPLKPSNHLVWKQT